MIINMDLEQILLNNAKALREGEISSEGELNDRQGFAFEKLFAYMLEHDSVIANMFHLTLDDIDKVIVGDENLINYTGNTKIDLIIILHNKEMIPLSLKCTGSYIVGALETGLDKVQKYLHLTNKESEAFADFANNGYKVTGMQFRNIKAMEGYFKRDCRDALDFVIRGKFRENETELQVKYIVFYDKKLKKIYVSTVEEYINRIMTRDSGGSFGSRMAITYTSGKNKAFKFKIKNPLRLESYSNRPKTNMKKKTKKHKKNKHKR